VPLDINCTVLVYARDRLASAGVLPPGSRRGGERAGRRPKAAGGPFEPASGYTLADWSADLARLTDAPARLHGVGLATGGWHAYAFVRANGGDVLREEGGRVRATFTDPRTVEAIRFLTELGHRHGFGPTPTTRARDYDDATSLFCAGRVAMITTGPWDFATIRKGAPGLAFGVAPFPAGLDGVWRGSVQGGGGLFVPLGSPNRELAFEWMKWATSDPWALRMARELSRFPVRRRPLAIVARESDPAVATFLAALPAARPYKLDAYPQANHAFMDAVKACFHGADPEFELARAQRVAQLAIDAVEAQE
jgi:ABC-type glycerol-3-phosphate transport system substrate-binding protein